MTQSFEMNSTREALQEHMQKCNICRGAYDASKLCAEGEKLNNRFVEALEKFKGTLK